MERRKNVQIVQCKKKRSKRKELQNELLERKI